MVEDASEESVFHFVNLLVKFHACVINLKMHAEDVVVMVIETQHVNRSIPSKYLKMEHLVIMESVNGMAYVKKRHKTLRYVYGGSLTKLMPIVLVSFFLVLK